MRRSPFFRAVPAVVAVLLVACSSSSDGGASPSTDEGVDQVRSG